MYHQAARNTEQMGRYQLEEKRRKDYGEKEEVKRPFWRKDRDVNVKLSKLNHRQKRDYIQKGILPNDSFRPAAKKTGL